MEIYNLTPFPVLHAIAMDGSGAEHLIVVSKMSWRINPDGALTQHEEQKPIVTAPVYRGDPQSSSLMYESDVVPQKAGTDCILIGHAWAPKTGTARLDAVFSVGPVSKVVRVFGERKWEKVLGMRNRLGPVPFEKIPLIYERAFGGADESYPDAACHETCLANPVGRAFLAKKSKKEIEGILFPNLEDPGDPYENVSSRPRPAGFGAIAPFWKPRADYTGTQDDNWQKRISPLPPADLKPEFFNCASPGLTSKGFLRGNELVALGHAVAGKPMFRFSLPGTRPQVGLRIGPDRSEITMNLDTVIVEPDDMRVQMVWRGALNVHGRVKDIRQIRIAAA
jgi:hypothetical protein